jgi:hypothetical protein
MQKHSSHKGGKVVASDMKKSSSGGSRRISFVNGANKVTYVKPPPKALNPDLWFKESDALVTKPMIFTLDPAPAKVNVSIDTSVRILSFGPVLEEGTSIPIGDAEEEEESSHTAVINGKQVTATVKPPKNKLVSSTAPSTPATGVSRMSLEIKQRDMIDELGMGPKFPTNSQFGLGGGKKGGSAREEPYNPTGRYFCVGTCSFARDGVSAANVGSGRIGVKLPEGQYELRNSCKDAKMVVYAQAVDVVRRLA